MAKKIAILISMMGIFLVSCWGASAQAPHDPTVFRPLGRFYLEGRYRIHSPDGYHIMMQEEVDVTPAPDVDAAATPTQGEAETAAPETPIERIFETHLTMWDIRGGKTLWTIALSQERYISDIVFAPDGSLFYVATTMPYPDPEEIRLTFYDTLTGEVISQTQGFDVIGAKIIPGDLEQALYTTVEFTPDSQQVIISYWRSIQPQRCAVWDVETATPAWVGEFPCGVRNSDDRLMAVAHPHDSGYSAYYQLTLYNTATGEVVATSEDEITDFQWLDASRILLHRPYGDPPIIWDVLSNARAVIELPVRLGIFQPYSIGPYLLHHIDSETYVWDKLTGGIVRQSEFDFGGDRVELDGRILLVRRSEYIPELSTDEKAYYAFSAYDFETEQEVWSIEWTYQDLRYSRDRSRALAYDAGRQEIDLIDMRTGTILGHLAYESDYYSLTPNWDWLYEISGNMVTVFGVPDGQVSFENPPNARVRNETPLRREPIQLTDNVRGHLRAEAEVWIVAQTPDHAWLQVLFSGGYSYWVAADAIHLYASLDEIPIVQ